MFERLLGWFSPEGAVGCSGEELLACIDPLPVGFPDLVIRFAGATFGGGLYRLYGPEAIATWTAVATHVFPELEGRILCFGMNWLGYQFALDVEREEGGEPLVLMLDPSVGEAVEIPGTFVEFHEDVLLEYTDPVLGSGMFEVWRAAGHPAPSDGWCAGYRVPLFLGGEDDPSNLWLTDAEVYWSLSGELRAKPGLPAPGVTTGDAQGA